MEHIQMVDLKGQYLKIKSEVDAEIQDVLDTTSFINGPKVQEFAKNLAKYTTAQYVIPCANGTDALQIALMALELRPGDEIIVPAFTYVATAEMVGLLGLTPVMVDVDYNTFNIIANNIKKAITDKTKAIVPVHLFGQSCDMAPILKLAKSHNLYIIEDNAQSIGSVYTFPDGSKAQTGTMGDIGCTSFFPSKNLGCYGDGGAILTNNKELFDKLKMIANHGQRVKYYHDVIGCNSRLDTIQAAVLDVKLKYLDSYSNVRYSVAQYYTNGLKDLSGIICPLELNCSTHVYHQYTIKVNNGKRDALKKHLEGANIPTMIYYPLPLQEQEAFKKITKEMGSLNISKELAESVLSLPIHTEMNTDIQDYIISKIKEFYYV